MGARTTNLIFANLLLAGGLLWLAGAACSSKAAEPQGQSGAVAATSTTGGTGAGAGSIAGTCAGQFDYSQAHCPSGGTDRDASVQDCLQQHRQYEGISCDAEYDAWVACTTMPPYDCANDTGCEAAQRAYGACQSRFVGGTGCTRLEAQDMTRCQEAKPYAFGCFGSAPSECTLVVDAGAGIWCCPKLM